MAVQTLLSYTEDVPDSLKLILTSKFFERKASNSNLNYTTEVYKIFLNLSTMFGRRYKYEQVAQAASTLLYGSTVKEIQ